jgi:hypothetical protein
MQPFFKPLFLTLCLCILHVKPRFGGEDAMNIITFGLDSARRVNALKVYTLFVLFQSIGLWIR